MKVKKKVFVVLSLLMVAQCPTWAQSQGLYKELPRLRYKTSEIAPSYTYGSNMSTLTRWHALLSDAHFVSLSDSIYIVATSSPEGTEEVNLRLAHNRADRIRSYVLRQNPKIDPNLVVVRPVVMPWSALVPLVDQDSNVPMRDDVLQILELPLSEPSKYNQLRLLANGSAYAYLSKNCLPELRYAALELAPVQGDTLSLSFAHQDTLPAWVHQSLASPLLPTSIENTAVWTGKSADSVRYSFYQSYDTYQPKPLFALKTNLLADLATALNLEIEIPIGRRWSIAVEGMFPWWLWDDRQYCFQMLAGHIEGRYWFADWDESPTLTGWFVGVYGGYGAYDVEWASKGYQGEFRNFGISGGYAHQIGRNLSMEYSMGVGYLQSNHRAYHPEQDPQGNWLLMYQQTQKRNWVGPTRLKVSLVWMINHGKDKRRNTL